MSDSKPPTFDVYRSEIDGTWVVHVQTDGIGEDEKGPFIRVYINDDNVYENPVHPERADESKV